MTQKRPKTRLERFLSQLMLVFIVILLIIGILALMQATLHPFDPVVSKAELTLSTLDKTLDSSLFSGVSLGTIVVILSILTLSMAGQGVHKRQYMVSYWRGILSSLIFFVSDAFYRYVRSQGMLYYSASLALFIVLMLILVEIISRWGSVTEERERRTELLASIVSGLSFGLLIQAFEAFIAIAKAKVPELLHVFM
ncbi:hypothetical protein [Gracilinema caldarium]|uniref:Uncharacterized protein n=1 Tax=Gracilinema caldarium (strain ATCC 51460 / DSM 7334 / H1) TaxID=744872 RepID=F8EXR7_GRAC1|nr:hypothetical protein [Gracilinema caldarium]AEJ20081.1 hypothetical protein Spica_1952 [Gracilinema caldarium DSM 7334]